MMGMATLRYGFATQGKPSEEDQPEWQQDAVPFDYAANSSGSAHIVPMSFGRAGVGGIYEVDKASHLFILPKWGKIAKSAYDKIRVKESFQWNVMRSFCCLRAANAG